MRDIWEIIDTFSVYVWHKYDIFQIKIYWIGPELNIYLNVFDESLLIEI